MAKLKLAQLQGDNPDKQTVTLPAVPHRIARVWESSRTSKLIAPMLEKFIASDREFAKAHEKKRHRNRFG